MTKFLPLLIPLLGLPLSACAHHEAHSPAPEAAPTPVSVAVAHREPFAVTYRASGTVRGRNTATLTSKTVGYVRAVHVRSGDVVQAGQPLIELEANDVRAGVAGARAALASALASKAEAEGAVDAATVSAKLAKTTHERMAALLSERAIPQQQFDDADARYRGAAAQEQMAKARLAAVTSSIDQARAALAESQAMLGYAKMVAPFSGRVLERRIDPGALASPGTPLLVLADEGALRVEAAVEESRMPDLRVGDEASIEIEALGRPVTGKVSEIVPSVDVASRAFTVKIDLPPDEASLRPGTFARVGFRLGSEPRLVVPSSAITHFGALDRVFVVDGGIARLRMVTHGESQGSWTALLSGLSENERVVSAPSSELTDGSRIEVKP